MICYVYTLAGGTTDNVHATKTKEAADSLLYLALLMMLFSLDQLKKNKGGSGCMLNANNFPFFGQDESKEKFQVEMLKKQTPNLTSREFSNGICDFNKQNIDSHNDNDTTILTVILILALLIIDNENKRKGVKKMKVFISQPMRDKTNEQIKAERNRAVEEIKKKYPLSDIEVLNSFFEGALYSNVKPLWMLGESLKILSTADVAYFIGDWRKYRGCKMEKMACDEYGIETITE